MAALRSLLSVARRSIPVVSSGSFAGAPRLPTGSLFRQRVAPLMAPTVQSVRHLNIHEYQSKMLMDKHGVKIQRWRLAESVEDAKKAVKDLVCDEYVVKAQVHAGGRGKGVFSNGYKGGVRICATANDAIDATSNMIGNTLHTKQTAPGGVPVNKVMIVESIDFTRELYFAILLDRAFNGPVMVVSPKGGMDIEAVAEETPDEIFKVPIDIEKGPQQQQLEYLAQKLQFKGAGIQTAAEQMRRIYDMFANSDATMVEVNPLVERSNGEVYAVDAKINFDDNASFRQQQIFDFRDITEEDPREVEASKFNLNYVGMDGNIGCMVNGAGLAMATMDIIKLKGGEPANFLDVGGGATKDQVKEAFKIVTRDPKVQAVLVNIFGGIMRCDVISEGIISAVKEIGLTLPLVVRLEGTNVDIAKQMLQQSGLNIITANDLDSAAEKAVAALR